MASSTLPEVDVVRVGRWCAARVPERVADQVRIECEVAPRYLTVVERRAPWREDLGPQWSRRAVARLRYTKSRREWSLYWIDSSERFHSYDEMLAPSPDVDVVLAELDRDPAALFWG